MSRQPVSLSLSIRDQRLRGGRLANVVSSLGQALADEFPSGFDFVIVGSQGEKARVYGGEACRVEDSVPVRATTLFDLASLTKVVVTTPLALWLRDGGHWDLDHPVQRWVPDYPHAQTTLRELLTHTSGLVAHVPFYRDAVGVASVRRALMREVAHDLGPHDVLYSDLNFMLLGWAIEQCAQMPLDRLFRTVIGRPLAMSTARFRPPPSLRRRIAATELDGDQRLAPGLVWGEVHDGNAFAMGGVSGHAGLFASAGDLTRYVMSILGSPSPTILAASTVREMARAAAGRSPDVRGLGWRVDPAEWGEWPVGTIWHTGFTGTSLLVAPALDTAVVLLTNAIHPIRQMERQATFRADLHRRVLEVVT